MTPGEHRTEALKLATEALRGALDPPDGLRLALVGLIHATLGGPAPVQRLAVVPAEDRELPPPTYVPREVRVGDPDPTDPEYEGDICDAGACVWPANHTGDHVSLTCAASGCLYVARVWPAKTPPPWQLTKAREDAERIKHLFASGEDPGQAASLEAQLLAATARAVVVGHPWARDMAVEAVAVLDTPGERWTA